MTIRSERELAKHIDGLQKVAMSGGGDKKGDLVGKRFLIEEKSSQRSYTLTKRTLEKLVYEAKVEFREPLMCIRIAGFTLWGMIEERSEKI